MSDLVLVTGVSGFLGGHVALQLLEAGFRVRGSVRNLNKAEKVRDSLARAGADVSRLDFVTLDLMSDDGWADAMQGVRYLQHVASPFVTSMPEDRMELIRPAVEGTRRALVAAFSAGVERVVLTSSMAAVMYGHDTAHGPFDADDWTNLEGRGVNAYIESKTRAEREAWKIAADLGRTADLAVVNPSGIMGPLLDDDPGTSAALIIRLMNGSVPAAPSIWFSLIDVRDVAAVHLKAMTTASAGGRRFPTAGPTHSFMQITEMLRAAFPAYAGKLPRFEAPNWLVRLLAVFDRDIRSNLGELGVIKRTEALDAKALLGRPFITAEDSVRTTARSLIDHHLL